MNIIFDLDDTIYNLMEPFEKTHEEMYADRTDAPCEQLFMASRVYSDEAYYMEEKGLITREEEFAYRIQKTYADVDIEVSMEEAKQFEKRYRYHQKHIHVPEEMVEILDMCKKEGIFIGILTNGKSINQQKKIDALLLERWFPKEKIYISGDIGISKPDKRAFFAVQEGLLLNPEETWFVGDTFEVDVEGAKAAGWHSVWFNHRKRKAPEGEISPDVEVRSLQEMKEWIQKVAF